MLRKSARRDHILASRPKSQKVLVRMCRVWIMTIRSPLSSFLILIIPTVWSSWRQWSVSLEVAWTSHRHDGFEGRSRFHQDRAQAVTSIWINCYFDLGVFFQHDGEMLNAFVLWQARAVTRSILKSWNLENHDTATTSLVCGSTGVVIYLLCTFHLALRLVMLLLNCVENPTVSFRGRDLARRVQSKVLYGRVDSVDDEYGTTVQLSPMRKDCNS